MHLHLMFMIVLHSFLFYVLYAVLYLLPSTFSLLAYLFHFLLLLASPFLLV